MGKRGRPKKVIEEDLEDLDLEDEDNINYQDEDLEDLDLEDNTPDELGDNEMPANAMALAYQISKRSEGIKHYNDLPNEVKFSFYKPEDALEVKHFARNYRDWKYIEKILTMRANEDKKNRENALYLKNVETKEDLLNYVENSKYSYMLKVINDFEEEDLNILLQHIKHNVVPNYMATYVEKSKDDVNVLYQDYKENSKIPDYIDDMDNLGKVYDTSLISMGYKGNAANHSIMQINATRNEDIEKKVEEKSSFSLIDSIRRRIG